MTTDLDKQFLISQRQKGRSGSWIDVDFIKQKEELKRLKASEKKRKLNENKTNYFIGSTLKLSF